MSEYYKANRGEAWNYFPHEILGGISPADLPAEASAQAEKLLEHRQKS